MPPSVNKYIIVGLQAMGRYIRTYSEGGRHAACTEGRALSCDSPCGQESIEADYERKT